MSERSPRHRYPIWLAWPIELGTFLGIVAIVWTWLRAFLRTLFQQWPQTLTALEGVPYVRPVLTRLIGTPPPPADWAAFYPDLLALSIRAFVLLFLFLLVRNFLPRLRPQEKGLQVRRGLGWVTVPWDRITLVHSMTLPGDRLVLLIQGRRLRLGPWFRFYSLLWGAGLAKGVVVTWLISDFDRLAEEIVYRLEEVHGEENLALVVDDMAYSFLYALLFAPKATWQALLARERQPKDAYAYPKWVTGLTRFAAGLLLLVAGWRYLGVWWRFLAGRFGDTLIGALNWPIIGLYLRTYGSIPPISPQVPGEVRRAAVALLLAHVSMLLALAGAAFLLYLFPNWLLGAEGVSVRHRKGWLAIPWQAIYAIRETIFQGGGVILLQTRRTALTFWHSLYSLFYGAGLRRGVLFTSLLPGFEDLRQRIHLGIIRAYEGVPNPPERAILQENGEAEFLLLVREPLRTLRRLAGVEEKEEEAPVGGGLLKRGLPTASDLPWERSGFPWEEEEEEAGEKEVLSEAERLARRRSLRAVAVLAAFPALLVLLEEGLFPPLSRPLAWFSLPPVPLEQGPFRLLILALLMGGLVLLEWLFLTLLLGTIAEMHEQSADFARARTLYPRVQSARVLVGVVLLFLAASGVVQPLFLLWWLVAGLWGGVLTWLIGREAYGWLGLGNLLLVAGYGLFQGLGLFVYFLLRV